MWLNEQFVVKLTKIMIMNQKRLADQDYEICERLFDFGIALRQVKLWLNLTKFYESLPTNSTIYIAAYLVCSYIHLSQTEIVVK